MQHELHNEWEAIIMTVKIKVYSDYVCPFCLLAKKPLEEAIEGRDVEIEWMPYGAPSIPK